METDIDGPSLRVAIEQAKKSNYMYRLGAVLLRKRRIVGRGYNKLKTHPKLKKNYGYHSIHAECHAIMSSVCEGDTLIVVRIQKNGELTMSKPCERCLEFVSDYGIKRVIYTDWDSNFQEIRVN